MATDAQNPKASGFRAALSYRDFRWLVIGLSVSTIGSWAYNVALYVYVYETTRSAAWAAATTLGRFVPSLIFGSYGGVIAERVERRRLLITLDLIMTVLMVALGVLTGVGVTALVAIVLAGIASVVGTIYYPATAAMTPQVVDEPDLAAANALGALIENVSVIAGPALGAVILALFSVEVAFFFNASTFAFSAWCSSRIHARSQPSDVTDGGQAGVIKQVIVGFRTITSSTTTVILVGASVLASFFYGTDTVLFVVYSDERLGIGPDGLGLLLAGLGVGGILVAPLVNRLAGSPRLATIISAGLILFTLPTALLLIIEASTLAFTVQILRGAGTLVVDVLAVTALQRSLPSDMIARVFGVFETLTVAAIALGAFVTAPLLAAFGLDTTLLIFSVGFSALVLVVYPRTRLVDRGMRERLDTLRPRITTLESLGIFASASRTALERLAAAAEEQSLPAGTQIIQEGAAADAFYVITDGQVRVSAVGELGQEQHLPTMGPGEYFGEIGLLEQSPRTASVEAIGDVVVYRIPGDEFIASLTETAATPAFMEGARTKLARTHPSRDLTASALEGPDD